MLPGNVFVSQKSILHLERNQTIIRSIKRMSKLQPSRNNGFSLVELLVVVAILAVLASILIPNGQRVGQEARLAQCASNQRQISSATKLYLADNKNIYMDHRYLWGVQNPPWDPDRSPKGHTWVDAIYPYLARDIYHCPDFPSNTLDSHDIGVGMNCFFLSQMDHRHGETGGTRIASEKDFPVTAIINPSMCIEYGDSEKKWGTQWGISLWWPYINRANEGIAVDRHGGAGIVAFADGHTVTYRDPDNEINPARDNTPEFIEYWDPRQRRHLWP